jgi:hypothetical protein
MKPSDAFFYIVPPSNVAGPNQVQNRATGAAVGQAVFTGLAAADQPPGKVWVCFEAVTNDCYVRFGPATSAGTTAANGLLVKAGQPGRVFYLDPVKHAFMDVFAPVAGTVSWQVCSPPGQRVAQ